jgi:hypothetical protein
MSLLTESSTIPTSGGAASGRGIAALDLDLHRDMRWCANCGGEQVFLEVYEFEEGRVGVCLGCGEERIVRFTRTNSEAA